MTTGTPADPARWRRIDALLSEALAQPPAELDAWLARRPAADQEFLPVLRELLARSGTPSERFMSRPVTGVLAQALGPDPNAPRPGEALGPYRLVHELGRGGMGTVWLAERADGTLQRQVALKLPLHDWAPGVAQRLRQERDSLAALEHPHIARLYDAGVSERGRPWIAMELVDGQPIDRYADEHALGVRQRLRLFLQVARAVAYAHGRLVVHRDLKPSNIFVTATGEVRLLDFGAAKLLREDGAPDSALTRESGRALSPDYASPEQILAQPITVASDVYSLGVVLYELLAHRRPYRLQRDTPAALEEAILRAEVPPPSAAVADRRRARELRGDLDTIVAKAMHRDPSRRYSSVEALADDIERHLAGEPVHAQPPRLAYRLGKFVRRRFVPLTAALLVVLAIAAGAGVALWQERIALAQAARAERVKQFTASIFTQAVPRTGSGGVVTATDLLDAAVVRIEKELADDPAIAAELGVIIAGSYDALGETAREIAPLRAAIPRAERAFGPRHPLTLEARIGLASALGTSNLEESARLVEAALPDAMAGLPATASQALAALQHQSFVRAKQWRYAESIRPLEQGVALSERYFGRLSERTIWSLGFLSNTYGRFGERHLQLQVASDAWQRARQAFEARRPDTTLTHVERWYGDALQRNDRNAEAVTVLRRVVADQRRLDQNITPRLRNAMAPLALALARRGELAEALPLMRQCAALEREQNPVESDDRLLYSLRLATVLELAGHVDEALQETDRADAIAARLALPNPRAVIQRSLRRAAALAQRGQLDAAAALAGDLIPRAASVDADYLAQAETLAARIERGQRQQAAARDRLLRVTRGAGFALLLPSTRSAAHAELGLAQLDLDAVDAAREPLQRCREAFVQAQIEASVVVEPCLVGEARLALRDGRAQEAAALLDPLLRQWQELDAAPVRQAEVRHWLARAREAAVNR